VAVAVTFYCSKAQKLTLSRRRRKDESEKYLPKNWRKSDSVTSQRLNSLFQREKMTSLGKEGLLTQERLQTTFCTQLSINIWKGFD